VWVYIVCKEMCDRVQEKYRALPELKSSGKEEEVKEEVAVEEGKASASGWQACISTMERYHCF
jgi:hypothetical protein